ncbi:unnamed protein product, partial [Sphagnum balticum]
DGQIEIIDSITGKKIIVFTSSAKTRIVLITNENTGMREVKKHLQEIFATKKNSKNEEISDKFEKALNNATETLKVSFDDAGIKQSKYYYISCNFFDTRSE